MDSSPAQVFIAGGTGYIGSRLIPRLLARGHRVSALVRPESQNRLPAGCHVVTGNALDAASYRDRIKPASTFVQLVGVAHPSPAKAAEFRSIDLVAGREAVAAASYAGIQHFVYVSVAQPAPMMKAYQEGARGLRGGHPEQRLACNDPAPLVRPRARTPLAVRADSRLLAVRKIATHARGRTTFGPGYFRADAADAYQRHCFTRTERARPWCAGDSSGQLACVLTRTKPA